MFKSRPKFLIFALYVTVTSSVTAMAGVAATYGAFDSDHESAPHRSPASTDLSTIELARLLCQRLAVESTLIANLPAVISATDQKAAEVESLITAVLASNPTDFYSIDSLIENKSRSVLAHIASTIQSKTRSLDDEPVYRVFDDNLKKLQEGAAEIEAAGKRSWIRGFRRGTVAVETIAKVRDAKSALDAAREDLVVLRDLIAIDRDELQNLKANLMREMDYLDALTTRIGRLPIPPESRGRIVGVINAQINTLREQQLILEVSINSTEQKIAALQAALATHDNLIFVAMPALQRLLPGTLPAIANNGGPRMAQLDHPYSSDEIAEIFAQENALVAYVDSDLLHLYDAGPLADYIHSHNISDKDLAKIIETLLKYRRIYYWSQKTNGRNWPRYFYNDPLFPMTEAELKYFSVLTPKHYTFVKPEHHGKLRDIDFLVSLLRRTIKRTSIKVMSLGEQEQARKKLSNLVRHFLERKNFNSQSSEIFLNYFNFLWREMLEREEASP